MKSYSVLSTPYTHAYSGGLIQYLLDFEEAYVEYDHVERTQALKEHRTPVLDTDAQRRERLFEKLYHERSLRATIRQCRSDNRTYKDCIQYFNDEALTSLHFDQQIASTRSRSARAHQAQLSHVQHPETNEWQAFLMSNVPQQFMIPSDLFYCIPEHARREFIHNRNQLLKKNNGQGNEQRKPAPQPDSKPSASNTTKNTDALPKQYTSRANVVDLEQVPSMDEAQADTNTDEESATDSLCDPQQYLTFLTRYNASMDAHPTDRDFFVSRTQIEPASDTADWVIETSHNLTMSLDGHHFLLLSDNGANSCLISRNAFHIDSIDPSRKAIIKGCKDSYVSRGNPIGTGRAVVVSSDPRAPLIGIRIHEAAIHNDDVSLLSEFQAREFGTVINSVARRHVKDDHDNAQSLIPHPDIKIPFQVRQALMTLTIRRPTDTELTSLTFHDLTSSERWFPHDHNDNGQGQLEVLDAVNHGANTRAGNNLVVPLPDDAVAQDLVPEIPPAPDPEADPPVEERIVNIADAGEPPDVPVDPGELPDAPVNPGEPHAIADDPDAEFLDALTELADGSIPTTKAEIDPGGGYK